MGRIVSLGPLVAFVPLAARAVAVGGGGRILSANLSQQQPRPPLRCFFAVWWGGVVLTVAQMGIYTTCCMFHTDGARRPAPGGESVGCAGVGAGAGAQALFSLWMSLGLPPLIEFGIYACMCKTYTTQSKHFHLFFAI